MQTTKPNTKTIEQEINEIRLQIYEEIKDMTPEQRVEYYKQSTADVIQKYGFRVISRVEENAMK